MPPIKIKGIKTAINDRLIAMTVNPTSLAPCIAAGSAFIPASIWREIFSSTTIASSITNPVEIVNAIKDKLSKVKPKKSISAKVPSKDKITATPGIIMPSKLPKNA